MKKERNLKAGMSQKERSLAAGGKRAEGAEFGARKNGGIAKPVTDQKSFFEQGFVVS